MKTDTKKTGNKTATGALADINAQIEALNQKRIGLAEPLKNRYAELVGELNETGKQIRDLDPTWKPASLKPKADDKIREIITAHGSPMTAEEIIQAVGDVFTAWKVKNTLKKKTTGTKATLVVNDGKYAVKSTA
jgi:DNA-directed RNA polymerase subunit F